MKRGQRNGAIGIAATHDSLIKLVNATQYK